jgi:hypothetical protein
MDISYIDYKASSESKIKRVKAKARFKYSIEIKKGNIFSLELSGGRILTLDQFKDLDGCVESIDSDIEEYVAEHYGFLNWQINEDKFSKKLTIAG